MSLTLLQAKEVNETDTEHQNQDNDDLHADFNQFDPNTTVYDAPASNSFEPNTTVSEAPAIIPMNSQFGASPGLELEMDSFLPERL
ncbi:Dper\GL18630-PA-like protein [Anopheles sinensis]|uniref:Dper\GL18630-PA-like protein n=1 Tax=Anopheles sinensis TaxID=74873 RepID=A0A084VET5_ANOSI|nr:Dper\GL18630-PA-like protein [Anopheles sinensis]